MNRLLFLRLRFALWLNMRRFRNPILNFTWKFHDE